ICTKPIEPVYDFECWSEHDTGELVRGDLAQAYTFIPQHDFTLVRIAMQGHKYISEDRHDCLAPVNLAPVVDDVMGYPLRRTTLDTAILPDLPDRWGDFNLDFDPVELSAGQEYAVQFLPGVWDDVCYYYRIRTGHRQLPVNAERGFYKFGEFADWVRYDIGLYRYFHGKFYKEGEPEI
ncbi:unnamed protein product, partial [marine sediment metagenome]